MKEIKLTQGYVAMVDDEDYDSVSAHKWCARKTNSTVYAYRGVLLRNGKRSTQGLHRFITDCQHGMMVDHVNGNGLDNRRANLRVCISLENSRNRHKIHGASRFKGVKISRGKWRSDIKICGKPVFLGLFTSEIDAARSYDSAALKYFGEFARVNTYDKA